MNEQFDNLLVHHGIKGMKWGEWNDETKKRHLGIRNKKENFLESQQAEQLKKTTMDSNDPEVVQKGMKLLSDEELKQKIERMELEDKVVHLANKQKREKYDIKRVKREARQKTLGYDLAKTAGNTVVNQTVKSLKKATPKAILEQSVNGYSDSVEKNISKYNKSIKKKLKERKVI